MVTQKIPRLAFHILRNQIELFPFRYGGIDVSIRHQVPFWYRHSHLTWFR